MSYYRRFSLREINISWKAVLVCSLCLCVAVLMIRGCAMSCAPREELMPTMDEAQCAELTVLNRKTGKVMHMELEEYIAQVVAAEMPVSFEIEALKAQAVAARTFAVRRMAQYGGTPCGKADVCTDSTCCQAYRSLEQLKKNWGTAYETNFSRVRGAVLATAGKVALYDGMPIEALYHSCSGGYTEDVVNVFAAALPYLVSVSSPGEESATRYESEVRFSRKTFAATVNSTYRTAKLTAKGLKKQIKIEARFESGRVERIRLGGATLSGRELRKLFELDSANFKLRFTDEYVYVNTVGFGHGVGLSQYGANAMAKEGDGYEDILEHYYTGITISDMSAVHK